MATKPASQLDWTVGSPTFGTDTVEPNGSKKQTGWQHLEKPAYDFMNWLFYNTDQWVKYFENPIGQIVTIDDTDSPYAATTLERWISVDTSAGDVTVNLPDVASSSGAEIMILKSAAANTVTIDADGSETINGQLTVELSNQYETIILKETGGEWIVANQFTNSFGVVSYSTSQTLGASEVGKVILLDPTAAAFNITLPTPTLGANFTIKDVSGVMLTNNVTLVRAGSENIEGLAADYILQANFGQWKLVSDGTDWYFTE